MKKALIFATASTSKVGTLAQLVEQRTENPCVPSSNLGGTTKEKPLILSGFFYFFILPVCSSKCAFIFCLGKRKKITYPLCEVIFCSIKARECEFIGINDHFRNAE